MMPSGLTLALCAHLRLWVDKHTYTRVPPPPPTTTGFTLLSKKFHFSQRLQLQFLVHILFFLVPHPMILFLS